MKLPKDKNGRPIQAGDTIRLTFHNIQRQYPGRRRVAVNGMSGDEIILPDEGGYFPPTVQWVDFKVKWSGACLIAERSETSDFQAITSGENVCIKSGKPINASSAMHYLNAVFSGKDFEVIACLKIRMLDKAANLDVLAAQEKKWRPPR